MTNMKAMGRLPDEGLLMFDKLIVLFRDFHYISVGYIGVLPVSWRLRLHSLILRIMPGKKYDGKRNIQ